MRGQADDIDALLLVRFDGAPLKATWSAPRGGHELRKVTVRVVDLKQGPAYQFTRQGPRQQTHVNLDAGAAGREAVRLLDLFDHLHLFTAAGDEEFRRRKDGTYDVLHKPPTWQPDILPHDRTKRYLLPDGVPNAYLIETGVMTAAGQVKAGQQHKFRQINRFAEFVDDVVPRLPVEGPLTVVDFGSGKSYLTFALHHLLVTLRRRDVRLIAVDRNAAIIDDVRRIAARLGCAGMEFVAGDISECPVAAPVDLVVALHACDTATDDALAQGIRWQARALLVAPCCQHELAPQLRQPALEPILKHGILRERLASLATDALRAELLEAAGYDTQVLEFIDLEHTPKNLLLRAVRRPAGPRPESAAAVATLCDLLGIQKQRLRDAL